ncbi:hypothetical protein [Alteromonas gilva]|uniref:Lipoprotein n=1 Tax=Alteromonas gilva TaxID=2987522 RepID=A0ABT5L8X1_9ALTE|nr:hypothetical protein [Alteromonas gilva]MDC8832971.1 hypothetical protein [Alteromonas gilva]
MKKTLLLTVVTGLFLGGCASSNGDLANRLEELEEQRLDVQEAREEVMQEQREEEIEAAPDWVLEPPQSDGTGMYGVGIAKSKSLSHVIKAARLQAEFDLAKMYKQELSGSERAFERGNSDGDVVTQTEFLIDKLVDSVPIVGYEVIEQVVKPIRGVNHAYVLLKLPFDAFNKVLQQERNKTLDKTVRASFDDLERRLDKRRKQVESEKLAQFNREQEALQNRAEIIRKQSEADNASKDTNPEATGDSVRTGAF